MLLTQTGIRSAGALGMLLVAAGAAHAGALAPQKKAPADSRMSTAQGQRLLAARSAQFIENKGQWDSRARFFARSENLDLWFTDRGIRYNNYVSTGTRGHYRTHVVGMTFAGGRAVRPVASSKQSGRTDYLVGKTRTTGAAAYSELYTKGVYPGIDVRSYFDGAKPRYDVIVAPGADAKSVRLAFKGESGLSIKKGELQVATTVGGFANGKPVAYQTIGGKRIPVAASWKLNGKHEATFALGTYDHSKALIIDPLVYGSYIGGNAGADEVRGVVADEDGGVYLTGSTLSAIFPVSDEPFGLNIKGGTDAFVVKLQGDAYNKDYAAYIGGNGDDVGTFLRRDGAGNVWLAGTTASLDFPGNTRPYVQYLRANSEAGFAIPTGGTFRIGVGNPAGGGAFSPALPFNATSTQVQTALRNLGIDATVTPVLKDGNGNLINTLSNGNPNNPLAGKYRIEMPADSAVTLSVDSVYRSTASVAQDGTVTGTVINEGLPPSYHLFNPPAPVNPGGANDPRYNFPYGNTQQVRLYGSNPLGGSYTVSYLNTPAPQTVATTTTPPILTAPADTGTLQDRLNALSNKGTLTFTVTGVIGRNTSGVISITDSANPTTTPKANALVFNNGNILPQMAYVINGDEGNVDTTDIFVMRFARSSATKLDPATNLQVLMFGSGDTDRFAGFDIRPSATPTDPVEFILAGSTRERLLNYPGVTFPGNGFAWTGFLAHYQWTPTGGFAQIATTTNANSNNPVNDLPYVRSHAGFQVDVRGGVIDADGNAYVTGTLYRSGNENTNRNSASFYTGNDTTAGATLFTYEGQEYGNRSRNSDAFVRKYARNGALIFSGLLGGSNFDESGGIAVNLDGTAVNTGSTIAVDAARNVYVTGVSGSFDFLRTRGVYGEVFTDQANVFVTKISPDGQTILYSTNLRSGSNGVPTQFTPIGDNQGFFAAVMPAGIAVDSRGYAYVTTNLRPNTVTFPGPVATVPDPNQPTGSTLPSIPQVSTIDGTYESPTGAEFPTTEGGLLVLNSTGTDLVFGTYLGGRLDDMVFAPYVDAGGDVWAGGWTDVRRDYSRSPTTGAPIIYITTTQLPSTLLSSFPFKESSDYTSGTSYFPNNPTGYGSFNTNGAASGTDQYGRPAPANVSMSYSRDGFVTRFRIDLPAVSDLTFSPATIPGGLGAFVTGTVTLTQAAPSGGTQLVVTLPTGTSTATLSQDNSIANQDTYTVTIPAGSTTATFRVYSKAVTANTGVPVRATVNGTFRERTFQVVPWLVSMTLNTDSVVGGPNVENRVRGTVTLAAPAPAGGVEIDITSSSSAATVLDIPFSVPEGQTSATFDVQTSGVAVNTPVTISAALLGVVKSQDFTIRPATLQSVTLNPDTVAGGSPSTVTVTLNGGAPAGGYLVNLTSSNTGVATLGASTLTIPAGESSATATITTKPVANSTSVNITASHVNADNTTTSLSAVLRVQALSIASVTLDPATVDSGALSTGTVTLATSAPVGGARVYLTVAPTAYATLVGASTDANGTYVVVAAGSKTATFQVRARYFSGAANATTPVTISATQGGPAKTATLNVRALNFTFTLDRTSVTGSADGTVVTGTITIPTAANEDLTFSVVSSNAAVTVDTTTVTIPAGSRTATFTIRAGSVNSSTTVAIKVGLIDAAGVISYRSTNLQITPVGIASLVPQQTVIRSGSGYLDLTVNFTAPTTVSGTLTLTISPNSVFAGARTFTVPAGTSIYQIHLVPNRLSRSQNVTITAAYNGTEKSTTVTVTR